jgi:hypothetical protein
MFTDWGNTQGLVRKILSMLSTCFGADTSAIANYDGAYESKEFHAQNRQI